MIKNTISLIDSLRWMYYSKLRVQKERNKLFLNQIRFVKKNIPFYKEYFTSNPDNIEGISDITKLPVIDKMLISKNPESFIPQGKSFTDFKRSSTSGSTGLIFNTYFDHKSFFRKKYITKLRSRFYNGLRINDRIAVLDSEPEDILENLNHKWSLKWSLFKLRYYSLLSDPNDVIKELELYKPTVLYGPPSFLVQLAELYYKGSYSFKIKGIFTSSELLTHNTRRFIEESFLTKVFDIYGSTEFKEIAWECACCEGYHINEDEVYVEILDRNNKPLTKGSGYIVVTDLRNKAMPLIRFNIQDLGEFNLNSYRCKCNFERINLRGGRATDYIWLTPKKKISPYIVEDAIELIDEIIQYQIVQHSYDKLEVFYRTKSNNLSIVEEKIENNLLVVLHKKVSIICTPKIFIDTEENGKFKLVKSHINP